MTASLEDFLLNQSNAATGGFTALAPVTAPATSPRCRVAGHQPCYLCAPHLTQGEPEEALDELPAVQAPVTHPKPAPIAAPAKIEAPPEPKGLLVQLAEQHEVAIRQLQRDGQLLVAAEARVDMLKESIAKLKSVAEAARATLADQLEKMKQETSPQKVEEGKL